jgi:hypothetical protein
MMFTQFEQLPTIHHAEGEYPHKLQLFEIDYSGDELVPGTSYNP